MSKYRERGEEREGDRASGEIFVKEESAVNQGIPTVCSVGTDLGALVTRKQSTSVFGDLWYLGIFGRHPAIVRKISV